MSNKGMTFVEVLAALVLLSIVSLVIYSALFNGLNTYNRVVDENEFRDAGDFIMAHFINEFYTLKNSEIKARSLPQAGTDNYYIVKEDEKKIGFLDSEVIINNQPVMLTNNHVVVTDESNIIEIAPSHFEINLVLKDQNSNKEMTLSSILSIVDDRTED